jgi:hypothetical protein
MIYNNAFLLDFNTLAIQLMPVTWRKPKHIAWLKVLVYPFVLILQKLRKSRKENIYKLEHDGRIGKIEKVLNDKFDVVERRILIIEGQRKNQNYSYFSNENKEQLATPLITYSIDEIAEFSADFEICIPTEVGLITSDITRLNTLARYYADKDKHFTIKLI